jgi:hypothetical protein
VTSTRTVDSLACQESPVPNVTLLQAFAQRVLWAPTKHLMRFLRGKILIGYFVARLIEDDRFQVLRI